MQINFLVDQTEAERSSVPQTASSPSETTTFHTRSILANISAGSTLLLISLLTQLYFRHIAGGLAVNAQQPTWDRERRKGTSVRTMERLIDGGGIIVGREAVWWGSDTG